MNAHDWNAELSAALAAGDPAWMAALLDRMPHDVVAQMAPMLAELARHSERSGLLEQSLLCLGVLVRHVPENMGYRADQVRVLLSLGRHEDALAAAQAESAHAPGSASAHTLPGTVWQAAGKGQQVPSTGDVAPRGTPESPPASHPDPAVDRAIFDDPAMPAELGAFRIEGVGRLLRQYSGQRSPGNAIARVQDPAWLAAWDGALSGLRDTRVCMYGSELGLFGVRARQHGAKHVWCVEAHPLDARIASGIVHKHLLAGWRENSEGARDGWSEAEKQQSFADHAQGIEVVLESDPGPIQADCLVFSAFDHTLLGTGVVRALQRYRERHGHLPGWLIPARATVYAMAIAWEYPGAPYELDPVNRLRWSFYPQTLDSVAGEGWRALTTPVRVATLEFADFVPRRTALALPVISDGVAHAVVFWFDLDLGESTAGSSPERPTGCIRPAVQYIDACPVRRGEPLVVEACFEESRIHFRTGTACRGLPVPYLPGWRAAALGDAVLNEAYRQALSRALAARPAVHAIDIGAGAGHVAAYAVQAGVGRVTAYEALPALSGAASEVLRANGLTERVVVAGPDCRQASPSDEEVRADLLILEDFDCSLIGGGVLHYLAHAREHLVARDARILPRSGRIQAQLVEFRMERVWDIDASLLNPYRAPVSFVNVDAATLPYRALSDAFDVFSFDFHAATAAADERLITLEALSPGFAGAVLFWCELELDEGHWVSNAPAAARKTRIKQGLQVLPELRVEVGTALPLVAMHDGSGLRFRWDRDRIPEALASPVPRWDPRWLAANQDLEQRMGSLLQHCAQNLSERPVVAQIAMRMAVDPARHGLDPQVAQRFAELLLQASCRASG